MVQTDGRTGNAVFEATTRHVYCVIVCTGKNDAYVTIKLGSEVYQTSVCERTTQPEWLEQCDLYDKTNSILHRHRNHHGWI